MPKNAFGDDVQTNAFGDSIVAVAPPRPSIWSRIGSALTAPANPQTANYGSASAGADSYGGDMDTSGDAKAQELALRIGLPIAGAALTPVSGGASFPIAVGAAGALTGEILAQQSEMNRGARQQASYGRMVAAPIVAGFPLGPEANTGVRAFDSAGNLLTVAPQVVAIRAGLGGLGGGIASGVEQKMDAGKINWGDVANSAAFGALFGGVMGAHETLQRTRAAKSEIFQLRQATGNFQGSDADFLQWVKAQTRGAGGPSMPAEEGAPVPEGQNPGLPEGYSEMQTAPVAPVMGEAPDNFTQGSSVVEQLPHTQTAAGSIPAPAPISSQPAPTDENAPPIATPTLPNPPEATPAPPAPIAPDAAIAQSPPAEENQDLNPTPAPPPMNAFGDTPLLSASPSPITQNPSPSATPSDVQTAPPTEPALTPAAVGGPAPAPAPVVDVNAGAGSGGLPVQRIREDLPEAQPIIARMDALTAIANQRHAAMAPGQVKDLTHAQDLLTPAEKTEFHALQMSLRPKTPAEAKADLLVKRQATVTPTPTGPTIAPKPAEDVRVSKLADRKQFTAQKGFILDAVKAAHAAAPETGTDKVTISVPGDGTFHVANTKADLQRFGDNIAKRFGKTFSVRLSNPGPREKSTVNVYSPFSAPIEGSREAGKPTPIPPINTSPTASDLTKIAGTAASADPTRIALHHVFADDGFSVASDGRQIFLVGGGGGKSEADAAKLNIPWMKWRNVIPEWIKAKDGRISIMTKTAPKPITVNTRTALKALDQAITVLHEKANAVQIYQLPKGGFGVSGFSPDFGDYMSDGVSETTQPFTRLNPQYLRNALVGARQAGHETVQLYPMESGAIATKGGDNFLAVTMNVTGAAKPLTEVSPISAAKVPIAPKPSGIAYQPGYGPNAKPKPAPAQVPPAQVPVAPIAPLAPSAPAGPLPDWATKPIPAQTVTQPPLMDTPVSRAPVLARIKSKIASLEKLKDTVEATGAFPSNFVQHLERRAAMLEQQHALAEEHYDKLIENAGGTVTKEQKAEEDRLYHLKDSLYDQLETAQGDLKAVTDHPTSEGMELIDKWLEEWQRRHDKVEAIRLKAAQAGQLGDVGAGFTPRNNGRSAASPGMASAPPMGAPPVRPPEPVKLRPVDNPDFSQLPVQLPEMVQFYRMISGGKNARIVEKINSLHGTALGVFRYIEGGIDTGKIELRADLFHLLSTAEKNALMQKAVAWAKLMKEANPDMDLGEAIRHKFEQLVKDAEAVAMKRDPGRALYVFAHEIGHYIDFLPEGTLRRGNLFGHMATLHGYLKNYIGIAPDIFPVPPSDSERAALRRQAEKDVLDSVKEVTETITREEPIYEQAGLTPKMITEVVGQTARDDFPEFYDWFAKLSRADKVSVLKQAMRGIVDERAARFGKRVQTGTKTVTETVTRKTGEVTPEAIKARYQELLRAELIKRGLISLQDVRKELEGVIAWWHKRETMPAYFRSGAEMYAETFSILMNNPAALEQRAPTWWKAFQQYMIRKPAIKKVYDQVQNDIKSGAIFTQRVTNLRQSWDQDEADALTQELQAAKIPWKKYRDLLNLHFNKQQGPIQALAMKQLGKPEADHLLGALKDYLYRQTAVEGLARQINMRVEAPLAKQDLDHNDLSEYMFHNRIVAGDAVETANSQGWSPNTSAQRLQEMAKQLGDARFATLQQATQQLRAIYEAGPVKLLQLSRTLNPETMDKITKNVAYSPFQKARDSFNPLDEGTIRGMLEAQYGQTATARIYRRLGYLGDIRSPYVALVKKAESLTRFAYKQIATKAIRDFLLEYNHDMIAQAPMSYNGHKLVPRDVDTPDVGTLYTLDDGKLTGWYVPRAIYETMERASGTEQVMLGAALRVLAWPKAVLTELNFGFWPVRFFRDLGALALQVPGGVGAMKRLPQAYAAARATFSGKQNPIADQLLNRLMVISRADPRGENVGHPDEMNRWLLRMNKHPELWTGEKSKIENVLRLWEAYKLNGQIFGRTSKALGMLHYDARFGHPIPDIPNIQWVTMPEWMKKRAVNELAGHSDLLERGASTAFAEVAGGPIFVNAWLRSFESYYKAQKADPMGVWTKFMMFVGLPALAFYAYEKGWTNFGVDPVKAEDERAMLRSIPERDKLRGFIKTLGWVDKKQGKVAYVVLPFPEQVRTLHAFWRKMLQTASGDKGAKLGAGSVLNYGGQDVPGANPMITEAEHWWQFAALGHNPYDSFRGKNVLDDKTFKAGYGTAQLAKQTLGDVTGGMIPLPAPNVPGEPETGMEQFMHAPIVGNLLGRWVRVSNAGLGEADQDILQPGDQHRAQLEIAADNMLQEITNGQKWTKAETDLLSVEPYLASYMLARFKIYAAGAAGPEVGDFMKANNEQKAALLKAWMNRSAAAQARAHPAAGRP